MAIELCRARGDEKRRRVPGDNLIPAPMATITHAVTINAPPNAVWPWLVQIGAGRAGWYSYDRIDNGGVPSLCRIDPNLQHVAIGDVLPALPGARDAFVVQDVIPEQALVLIAPIQTAEERARRAVSQGAEALRASWALVLEPADHERTRLISRGRVSHDWLAAGGSGPVSPGKPVFIERVYSLLARMPPPILLLIAGSGHYLMETRMLRGVKRRAEPAWSNCPARRLSN